MDPEYFKQILKKLRAKYHPDNFEKLEDPIVLELATERFQQIEHLAKIIEAYFKGKEKLVQEEITVDHPSAKFAFDNMKIEVMTSDKDLKYILFGTSYRMLQYGQHFKIPGTKGAYLIIDEAHRGTRVGFREAIRMYITFGVEDSTEKIADWLYSSIANSAHSILVEGKVVPIDREAILRLIRKTSLLQLGERKIE